MAVATATANPLRVRLSPYWPHAPSARQYVFLSLPHLEALYGGAAGGGKTDALLLAALQYVDVPGYSAVLLRRTYKQLTEAGQLLDLSRSWLRGTDATWHETEARWEFPSGATIRFGHLDSDRDLENYSGPTYQFIGVDELTQFPEAHYRFLFSRLRRTDLVPVPVRMRAASNPGGIGHRWVKARFVDPPRDPARMFVPAKAADNPALDQDAYKLSLAMLDEQTRRQLAEGDWNARPPGDWVFDQHGIDAAERLGHQLDEELKAGVIDPPIDDAIPWGGDGGVETHLIPVWEFGDGAVYIPPGEVVTHHRKSDHSVRLLLAEHSRFEYRLDELRYDSAHPELSYAFEELTAELPGPPRLWGVSFSKRKVRTLRHLQALFENAAKGKRPWVAVSPRNVELLRQLRALLWRDPDAGIVDKGDDHGPDALVAGTSPVAERHATLLSV